MLFSHEKRQELCNFASEKLDYLPFIVWIMCKKAVYIIPEIRVVMVRGEVLMSASGGTGATGEDMPWGGRDNSFDADDDEEYGLDW